MKGRSRSGFTPADFNPLAPGIADDYCPTCGTRIRDNRATELKVCPLGPHEEPA